MLQPPSASYEVPWMPSTASRMWVLAATEGGAGGGDDDTGGGGGGGKEPLQNWSSLIGIVTAIVGNILIALALNVQRYAHTRLHKQRLSIRRRARAAMKRVHRGGGQSSSYGTVDGNGNGNGNGNRNRNSSGSYGNGATISDDDDASPDMPDDTRESDPLSSSYLSSASTEGGEDEEEAERQAKAASSYLKSPYWWLGQILITLGEMGNFLAYGFAPASIVSPLGVVALISNCIIAPLMFHERFRQRDFWGVVVAVGGVVTVVLSAKTQENKLNPSDVWGAITTLEFEIYLGVTVFLIIVLMWASPRYGRRTILIDLGLVGLFGGYTALATKGVSSMLSSTLWRAFTTPVTYVLIIILLGTAIMQIRYVNKSLQRFDSTQVIPIQFVMFTLCVILGSAILYRDFERTTSEQAGKFVGGCLLTFFGVFLITSGRQQSEDDEEDLLSDSESVEETIGLRHHEGHQQGTTVERQSVTTSVPPSRRSSRRTSRGEYSISTRPRSPDEEDNVPPLAHAADGSTPSSLDPESPARLSNPWVQTQAATPPGRGVRTLSADMFMRGSSVLTPSRSHPVTPMRDGLVPPDHTLEHPATPQNRGNTSTPGQHRRSGTFISPSPLASTVTTVMKDGFLRDNKTLPQKSSTSHLRSRIRASLFFNEDENTGLLAADDRGDDLAYHDVERDDDAAQTRRTRSRSLSDTLGHLFKSKKKRRKDGTDYMDVEQGDETDTQPGPSS